MRLKYTLTPNFYIGVYRGIHNFLIFALKQRLWVLVRTAPVRRFYRVPTIYVLSKNKKIITIFHLQIIFFTAVQNCSILHGHVCVMGMRYFMLCITASILRKQAYAINCMFLRLKNYNFRLIFFYYFHILAQNINCEYT